MRKPARGIAKVRARPPPKLKSPADKIGRVQREWTHLDRSTGLIGPRETVRVPSAELRSPTESVKVSDRRVSLLGSFKGFAPRQVNSNMQPRDSSVGPLIVPLASKSPGCRLQPLIV